MCFVATVSQRFVASRGKYLRAGGILLALHMCRHDLLVDHPRSINYIFQVRQSHVHQVVKASCDANRIDEQALCRNMRAGFPACRQELHLGREAAVDT